jgi:hypothetical protein
MRPNQRVSLNLSPSRNDPSCSWIKKEWLAVSIRRILPSVPAMGNGVTLKDTASSVGPRRRCVPTITTTTLTVIRSRQSGACPSLVASLKLIAPIPWRIATQPESRSYCLFRETIHKSHARESKKNCSLYRFDEFRPVPPQWALEWRWRIRTQLHVWGRGADVYRLYKLRHRRL